MSYPIMDTAIVMTVFVWIWFVSLFNVKIEKYYVWHIIILPTKITIVVLLYVNYNRYVDIWLVETIPRDSRQNIVFYVMGGGRFSAS
jgi:hypothetical protein